MTKKHPTIAGTEIREMEGGGRGEVWGGKVYVCVCGGGGWGVEEVLCLTLHRHHDDHKDSCSEAGAFLMFY